MELTADVWSEFVVPRGAEPVWSYADGPAAGHPAVTRHALGDGSAWYVSSRLSGDQLDAVLARACADAGLTERQLPRDVEVVERVGEHGRYLFALNHTGEDALVPLAAAGVELLTGEPAQGQLSLPAHSTRVVRLPR